MTDTDQLADAIVESFLHGLQGTCRACGGPPTFAQVQEHARGWLKRELVKQFSTATRVHPDGVAR